MTASTSLGRRIWGETWRVLLALVAGVATASLALGPSIAADPTATDPRVGLGLLTDTGLGLLAVGLVLLRRRLPVTIGIVTGVLAGFSAFAVPAAMLVLVSVATRRRWLEIAAVLAVSAIAFATVETFGLALVTSAPGELPLLLLTQAAVLGITTLVGLLIGGRRERVRLRGREQQLRAERAREHERARIAREMHDVLAHRLSTIAMHAGALRHRTDLDATATASAVATVHDSARLGLDELRGVLGALREQDGTAPPQPTLLDLPELLADHPTASLELDLEDELAALPDTVSRHAYRIVQECLTNARRHAPEAPVLVRIAGSPGRQLSLTIANPTSDAAGAPSAGFGLLGIEERAASVGGTAVIRSGDGEHRVEVSLPWARR